MRFKKIFAYVLIALVLMFATIGILGIWGLIDIQYFMKKIGASIIVLFSATGLVLLVLTIFFNDNN